MMVLIVSGKEGPSGFLAESRIGVRATAGLCPKLLPASAGPNSPVSTCLLRKHLSYRQYVQKT